MTQAQTIDISEVEKFSRIADEWWDVNGKFKPLHLMNPVRISYIREKAISHFKLQDNFTPFTGLKTLDIGCGGGLLSEPMARLGASVTAVDASEKNINVAKARLTKTGLNINYLNTSAEELLKSGEKFDLILNMEVIEHVADYKFFLETCVKLLNPSGLMFVATLNRTPKSYLFAIVGAEYVLRMLPRGTHEWKKFLKPSEIDAVAANAGLKLQDMTGVHYNPIASQFKLVSDVSVNYIMVYGN